MGFSSKRPWEERFKDMAMKELWIKNDYWKENRFTILRIEGKATSIGSALFLFVLKPEQSITAIISINKE